MAGLRVLLAGGDVLQPESVRTVLSAFPSLTVINGYGPTENTTFTCCHAMTAATPPGATVPIGKPITGTTVRVLDENGRPVRRGEAGVLYAGGIGLALGYLNDRNEPVPLSSTILTVRIGNCIGRVISCANVTTVPTNSSVVSTGR